MSSAKLKGSDKSSGTLVLPTVLKFIGYSRLFLTE